MSWILVTRQSSRVFTSGSLLMINPANGTDPSRSERYPGQTNNGTGGKIPTVIWYTSDGEVYGAGAEKRLEKHKGKPTISQEDLVKVEWSVLIFG